VSQIGSFDFYLFDFLGLFGMVQRGEADLAYGNLFTITYHFKAIEYSDW